MPYKTVIRFIAVFIAVLLLYAAVGQLMQYRLFCLQLQKLAPAFFPVYQWAWIIPCTALLTAAFLMLPTARTGALLAALFLLNVYTMLLTFQLDDQYAEPCHCGEPLQQLSIAAHIAFNVVCVALVCVAVSLSGKVVNGEWSMVNRVLKNKRPIHH
jgi:hypothetical protein